MSKARFAMVSEAMLSDSRLTGRQFKVLCALRMFADSKTGEAHPKRSQIADATGIAENKITDDTRALEHLGWLTREGDGGRSTSTIYTLFDEPKTNPETGCLNQPRKGVGIKKETHPELGTNPPQIGVVTHPESVLQPTPKRGDASNKPITDQEQTNNIPVAATPVQVEETAPAKAGAPKVELLTEFQAVCRATWEAYTGAYFDRYGIEPVRNAKVSSQVVQFCKRVPQDEAPHIAEHFVSSNSAFYVSRGHQFGNLLTDAEKLRTEWATGRSMTSATARQLDSTQTNLNAVDQALAMMTQRRNA
ncbi:MAG: helix-turn-helix domain-containing protein [Sphingobium sp.]